MLARLAIKALQCGPWVKKVLAKFPVIQHVLFGSLLPLTVASMPVSDLAGRRAKLSRESLPKPPDGFSKPSILVPLGVHLVVRGGRKRKEQRASLEKRMELLNFFKYGSKRCMNQTAYSRCPGVVEKPSLLDTMISDDFCFLYWLYVSVVNLSVVWWPTLETRMTIASLASIQSAPGMVLNCGLSSPPGHCNQDYGQEKCLLSSTGGALVKLGCDVPESECLMSDQMPQRFSFHSTQGERRNLFHQRSLHGLRTALKQCHKCWDCGIKAMQGAGDPYRSLSHSFSGTAVSGHEEIFKIERADVLGAETLDRIINVIGEPEWIRLY
ncbi:hypothetical protein J6590_047358 [Homalodisca vitripennis]|nr:hypothetical protein J6590_047358 [Homalodisca vitripennis]